MKCLNDCRSLRVQVHDGGFEKFHNPRVCAVLQVKRLAKDSDAHTLQSVSIEESGVARRDMALSCQRSWVGWVDRGQHLQ